MKNRKIKNAKEITYNNIHFKSGLEVYCYKQLRSNNVKFKYEEDCYELIAPFESTCESFEFMKKRASNKIRAISYTPDFTNRNTTLKWVIECKGFKTNEFKIKWKLFKRYLETHHQGCKIFLPRNQNQIDWTIKYIKENIV